MGLKASAMYHPRMEHLNSLEATSKRDEDDSLRFAFSLPCSPTPGFQPVMERRKSSSLSSLSKPMFYLNASNGSHIVLRALKNLDWARCTDRNSDHCVMKWTETVLQVNYQLFREGEVMVNHIPNCGLLTNKLGMLMSLRQYEYACQNSSTGPKKNFLLMKDFVPETYCVDDMRDRVQFLSTLKDGQVWIYKPSGMNQGKGIQLIRGKGDFERLQEDCVEEWRRNPGTVRPRILQRYIDQPLLLEGRKFDIRCYLLIASAMPFLVLFHPGYVRVCTRKYDVNSYDLLVHLTNQYIQKKDPNYSKLKEDTVWSMDRFNDYVNANYLEEKKIEHDWVKTTLMEKMQNIAQHCFLMVKDKLASRIGLFEIYGMDFMVDSHMNVFLIEINTNPAMSINCEVLKQVIPPVVSDFIDISVECFEKARRWKPLLPIQGITPLLCGYTESQTSQRSWSVSLNPLLDDEAVINYGLPPSFTVLYYETLDMARNRKATTNEVALRLWTSPHYPRLDNGENAKHKAETEKVNVVNLASALPTNPARLLPAKFPGQMASIRPVKTPSPSVHQSPKPKVLTHGPSKDYPGRVRLESKVPHGRPSPLGAARSPLPDILPKSTNVNCSLVSTLLDNLEAAYPPPGAFRARKGSVTLERDRICPNLTNNSAATEKGSNYYRKNSLSLRCRKLANRMLAPITKVEVISTEMPGRHLVYASPVHGSLAGSSPLFPRRCANRFSQVV